MKSLKFLHHLVKVLNAVFSTNSFNLTQSDIVQIYSYELSIAVVSLVNDPDEFGELSLADLFKQIEKVFYRIKTYSDPIESLVIISTNNEEELIFKFIDFQKKKMNLDFEVEFWGWETIRKIFDKYPIQNDTPQLNDADVYLNFIPNANIYQLFGIDENLKLIDEKIDSALTPVVIHNPISGTGKTALALAYIFHYDYQKKFDHYAYVNISSNIKLDFVNSFDGNLGFVYKSLFSLQENFYHLIDLLNKIPGRNLLIVDGVDNIEHTSVLIDLANNLKWKILITSVFRIYGFENIFLDHPNPDIATKIFLYFFKDLDNTAVLEKLLDNLYYHPFAIVFMAKTLTHFADDLSVEELYKMTEEMEKRVFHLGNYLDKRLSKNQLLLIRTILKDIMAVFDFQARNFSSLEKQILTIASVLPYKYVTFELLKKFVDVQEEENFSDTILNLLSKGWLEADKDKFKVSPLVKIVLHKKLKPSPNKIRKYVNFILENLMKPTTEAMHWLSFAEEVIASLNKIDVDIANIILLTAQHYDKLGENKVAYHYYEYAGIVLEQLYQSTKDVNFLEALAKIWARIDYYERALFYAQLALQFWENKQEENNEQLIFWYKFLASIYQQMNNYEKAIELADNALDMATMLYDKQDPRLKEIEQFHKNLSLSFTNQLKSQEKKQWLKRFFI